MAIGRAGEVRVILVHVKTSLRLRPMSAAPDSSFRTAGARPIPARWRDLRLILGLALIVVAMVVGWRLLAAPADTVTVWRASRDLAAGAPLTGLQPAVVPRALAAAYLAQSATVEGTMRWPVASGELVPAAAVLVPGSSAKDERGVTVAVDPRRLPAGLAAGDRVDLWSTDTEAHTAPHLVLSALLVRDVSADPSGVTSQVSVHLAVPSAQVGAVVDATRRGDVDLVTVPITAGGTAP